MTTIYREAERQRGLEMAGALGHLLDAVAHDLHNNESLHLHDCSGPVERCGYCYLRAGRVLGIVAQRVAPAMDEMAPETAGYAPDVDRRIDTLLRDIGEHLGRLYRGENIGAGEAVPLLSRAFKLTEAACGFSGLSTVEDVLDAIDEAI